MFAFMKKGSLCGLLLFVSVSCYGQTAFNQHVDTVKSIHRTGGSLDTLSITTQAFQSAFFISPNSTILSPFQLYAANGSTLHTLKVKELPLLFSALPHLGFSYAFGAQGSQRLKVDFQESFKHGILVNLNFDKSKGNGFLRNDDFSFQQFNAHILRTGERYSADLQTGKELIARSWSNGLTSPNPIPNIDLSLQSVQKENAHSDQTLSFVRLQHRFDFDKDSTKGFGLLARHEFHESKREYQEFDSLTTWYQNVFWDLDSTQDRFRERTLTNDVGIFLDRSQLNLQSALSYRIRNWHDKLLYHDTTELWWRNDFSYRTSKFQLEHRDAFNILGAGNGLTSSSKITLPFSFLHVFVEHKLSSTLPELMQRNYFSNNVQYQLNSLENQWNQSVRLSAIKKISSIQLEAGYQALQFRNVYVFDQMAGTWRNDQSASEGNGQSVQFSASWTYKGLQIKPEYRWIHFSSGLNFQPQHQSSLHVQWKGGVFKAKKLRMLFATDAQYLSSFQQILFNPQMGVFDLIQSNPTTIQGYMNLSFTTALEVETFRFFVRVDNIGSFWVPSTTAFVSHYAFPSMQIKIGLTWDFWN
jgi:hypothetical protein